VYWDVVDRELYAPEGAVEVAAFRDEVLTPFGREVFRLYRAVVQEQQRVLLLQQEPQRSASVEERGPKGLARALSGQVKPLLMGLGAFLNQFF
ncbi:hypothetical protein GUF51_16560, partial [Xanthomonas citri pv. citri]|nr:hypothetical protein [Xanthomonas citri pv. citri]